VTHLAVQSIGTFTPVGRYAGATMGSLRCASQRMREFPFMTPDGEPLVASAVDLSPSGEAMNEGALYLDRLVAMGAFALKECVQDAGAPLPPLPLLLCAPEKEAFDVPWGQVAPLMAHHAGVALDLAHSALFASGRASVVQALAHAQQLLQRGQARACLVGGVDSLVQAPRLAPLIREERVRYALNRQGFIPGEGAAFLLVDGNGGQHTHACISGVGIAAETRTRASSSPNSGAELARAMRAALADARRGIEELTFLAHDCSGERFGFKEFASAIARVRIKKLERWTATISMGEMGAAIGPLTVAYLSFMVGAMRRGGLQRGSGGHDVTMYAAASDGPARGAVVVTPWVNGHG
jgi:3-oxoacyl-[acyl-carrier-protein] synthase-1